MSTGSVAGVLSPILTPRQRKSPFVLPSDPSDEELARDWTLSAADLRLVRRSRGKDHRRRCAVQLCVLRKYGRFLDDYATVHGRILVHLCQQLGVSEVLFLGPPSRGATESEYEARIREYLGYRPYDVDTQKRLKHSLADRAAEGVVPRDLFRRAEETLRSWKVVLPAPSTLERVVASAIAAADVDVFERIANRLPADLARALDDLLEVPPGDQRSGLFHLKTYPPAPTAAAIRVYLDRYNLLSMLGVARIDLSGVGTDFVRHLAQLARRYDVDDLKRFPVPKRRALVACFVAEAGKTILDHVAEMHDQFLTDLCRRARHAFEERHREFRRRAKEGLSTLLAAAELLLDPEISRTMTLHDLYRELDESRLREARDTCREFTRLEERGFLDEVDARYGNLRRYLSAFFALPFEAGPGTEAIRQGLALAREIDAGKVRELPVDAPLDFVPAAWRAGLEREDGTLDRKAWEVALAMAVRDALRSGDLYLVESRRHVSFWNLVYGEECWARERAESFAEMSLPRAPQEAQERMRKELEQVAAVSQDGLRENPFADVREDRLVLKRPEALEIPDRVRELKRAIETSLPKVRIEDLLLEVDTACGFTKEIVPLGDYEPRSERLYPTLLATLVAQGTNLGIAAMAHSAEGISVEMLHHAAKWFLREETLRAANAVLVNHHHALPLASVWGEGTLSSSDGQRFGVRGSSALASFYPRYFGYYDRAVSVYTHTSDQHSVFSTKAISCSVREALYVLDGLLENDTVLRPREHTTDTHGYTEHIFALCYLLGIRFMPRIKDLADQQLYKLDRETSYGRLDPLFHGVIDSDLIREQYDGMVRVAASLLHRTSPAHVVVQRLASSPADRLAKAFTQLGRLVKTIYILEYIQDEKMRRRVHLQLNRGEARHELARWLFFGNRGDFRSGDYEEIMNKATCLSLLSNAVLVWNTVEIAKVVERLRADGVTIQDEDLARISPLMHGHVIPNGTYRFRSAVSP